MRARSGIVLGLVGALSLTGGDCLLVPPAEAQNADVFVPGFWDPQRPAAKPDLEGVASIRFVTADDYPPFHFKLPDGTLAGFEIDLARAVCSELQVPCTIQARPWATLVTSLNDGESDAVIASLSITRQAATNVLFTAPYYRTPARFVTALPLRLPDARPEALAGKTVAVEAGSAQAAYAKQFFPKSVLRELPSMAAARAALKAGAVELVFADGIDTALWLGGPDADGCCGFLGGPFTEARFFGAGAGIAVRKSDLPRRRALDYGLARVAAKGIYADLYLKYFPIGFY